MSRFVARGSPCLGGDDCIPGWCFVLSSQPAWHGFREGKPEVVKETKMETQGDEGHRFWMMLEDDFVWMLENIMCLLDIFDI